jgi:hypothetical protein
LHYYEDLYPEAEFLGVIGTKVLKVFLLAIHGNLYLRIPPPPSKNCLKLVCNENIVYGNLKSENSQVMPYFFKLPQPLKVSTVCYMYAVKEKKKKT